MDGRSALAQGSASSPLLSSPLTAQQHLEVRVHAQRHDVRVERAGAPHVRRDAGARLERLDDHARAHQAAQRLRHRHLRHTAMQAGRAGPEAVLGQS